MKARVLLGLVATLAGCRPANDESWMPLAAGSKWNYRINRDLAASVDEFAVSGPAAVDGLHGVRITGPGGSIRLAWRGRDLVADQIAGRRFDPPAVILQVPTGKSDENESYAMIENKSGPKTDCRRVKFSLLGKNVDALQAIVTTGGEVTKSWYVRGIGLVRQETRRDGKLEVWMDYLSGP